MFSKGGKIDLASVTNEQLASSLQILDGEQQLDNLRVNDLICSGKISLSLYLQYLLCQTTAAKNTNKAVLEQL